MIEQSEAITRSSDLRDNHVVESQPQSSVSLSVVTGNGLTASTSSAAMGVSVSVNSNVNSNANAQSPQLPDTATTRATKTNVMGLDFIGTSNAVKKLFSMSLDALSTPGASSMRQAKQSKKPTLIAVHNFDGTLIIDDAEDESNYEYYHSNANNNNYYERASNSQQSSTTLLPPSSQSLALALIDQPQRDQLPSDAISMLSNIVQSTAVTTSTNESESEHKELESHQNPAALLSPPKAPREYLQWNFQDLNMLLGNDTLVVRPPNSNSNASSSSTKGAAPEGLGSAGGGIAVRVEDVRFLRGVWEAYQRKQQLQTQQQTQQQQIILGSSDNTRSYAQALLQEREEKSPKELSNTATTSAVISAVVNNENTTTATTTANDPPSDDNNLSSAKEKISNSSLSEVPLQNCIVPFPGPLGGKISSLDYNSSPPSHSNAPTKANPSSSATPSSTSMSPKSADPPDLSIVLDAYLDNLMANVPQLALCLEEKGLIQSVKVLPTEEIPSMMLHPSTLDTSRPLDVLPSRGGGIGVGDGGSTDGGNSNSNNAPKQRVNRRHRRRSSGSSSKLEETMFSPQIMEMNASALLRFLKTNCTRNHATYLLRHEGLDETAAGDGSENGNPHQNIQLYDISSISTQKQKKWIWWLATMSYRFALRLRHLETSSEAAFPGPGRMLSEAQKRSIRDRQRSLFQQTLDLLQDLMDIDGNAHESMVASVREHMADTYLSGSGGTETTSSTDGVDSKPAFSRRRTQSISESPSPPVATATTAPKGLSLPFPTNSPQLPNSENAPAMQFSDSSNIPEIQIHQRQPYAAVSVDALNKAQDHLVRGIKTLSTLFESDMDERRIHLETKKREEVAALKRSRRRQRKQRFREEANSNSKSSKDQEEKDDGRIPRLSPAMVLQLFGMNFKLVNISLRLAEHHLGNYYSSSAMQALRAAARRLNDAAHLLDYYNDTGTRETESERNARSEEDRKRTESLQLQYIWLLEHCGHFARSFASDELWRDRGHASGEDVISVLSDVENVFVENRKSIEGNDEDDEEEIEKSDSRFWEMVKMDVLLKQSKGKIGLHSLSGIVPPFQMKASKTEEAVEVAKVFLAKEKVLRRERRKVLVASCVLYSRAITALQFTVKLSDQSDQAPEKVVLLNLLHQRLGDACNETGKVLLAALRTLLVNNQGSRKNDESQLAAEALLDSTEFWFTQGLEAFEDCKDARNLALLRCNLCQSFKFRANSGFSKRDPSSSSSKHAEDCLQQAADHLMTAHIDLGQRDVDPQTWDMVSEELAATFLVLGVRRRQSLLGSGNAPVTFQFMRLSPGEERSIVYPMERALKIYEQSDNSHQAAAVHYQLALTYSKLWTCQLNESNTRKKLSKAFDHYSSAFDYFSTSSRWGIQPTFCLLCLDLASLYAAIPGEEGLIKSLGTCLDCCDTFSAKAINASTNLAASVSAKSKADWYDKMETIAKSLDDRVFKLLRSLVKVDPDRYKDWYRAGLTAKMVRNVPDDNEHEEFDRNPKSSALLALHEVLLAIKKLYRDPNHKTSKGQDK